MFCHVLETQGTRAWPGSARAMQQSQGRPLSRALVRMIREISKNDALTPAEGLRAIEERQAKEIEFYLQACALRLESGS